MVPHKIVDGKRKTKYGVVVSSLQELMKKGEEKLNVPISNMRVVLESDGTIVDDQMYFSTLERNTNFVILSSNENWIPNTAFQCNFAGDEVDSTENNLIELLNRLTNDIGALGFLSGKELELLSELEPSEFKVFDRKFLQDVKEASIRYLNDKVAANEAMQLLKMYRTAEINRSHNNSTETVRNCEK